MTLQLADYVHKLHTYVIDSIRRKRRFIPKAFWGKCEVGELKLLSQKSTLLKTLSMLRENSFYSLDEYFELQS